MIAKLKKIRDLKNDEDGIASVELVLSVPILVWALLSTHVYFDAFKAESLNTRANLTIADMYSREAVVGSAYVSGTYSLLSALTAANTVPSLRVTSYLFDAGDPTDPDDDEYIVIWSEAHGSKYEPFPRDSSLSEIAHKLPVIADNSTSLLIETNRPYVAPFSIGIGPFIPTDLEGVEFNNFTAIRPRFEGEVCFQDAMGNSRCADDVVH